MEKKEKIKEKIEEKNEKINEIIVEKNEKQENEADEPVVIISESQQNKYIIITIIIIILIIGSLFLLPKFYTPKIKTISDELSVAYKHQSETTFVYNGFSFIKKDGSWYTNIQSSLDNQIYTIPLHFSPKEVENISLTGDLNQFLARLENNISEFQYQTYLTFDPIGEDLEYIAVSTGELSINLGKLFNIAVIGVCNNEEDPACTRNQTKAITCENTNNPVIFFKEGSPNKIIIENNCLTIQGREYELVKGTDRLLYKMYGIIKE